ncbi:MAG TPA: hypothetical protein VF669_18785 [Tepidisphaeraceae bacterium]|jgi:Amt family ammonium transporter
MDKVAVPVVSLVVLGSLGLLVRVGMALHACGTARSKNAASAMLRSIVEMSVAALAFWAVGGAILMGVGNGAIGFNRYLLFFARAETAAGGMSQFFDVALFYNLVLALIATGPISAAMGERGRTFPLCVGAGLVTGILVPICGYWSWVGSGWLARMGFIDAAGGSVVHVTGGLAALLGAMLVGARQGKYNNDRSSNFIPGHSGTLAMAGVLLMLVGWIPYVVGASLLHAAVASRVASNVVLAGAAGTIISYGMSRARFGKADVHLTMSGMLGGLVSITAGAGAISPIAAVAVGALGGWMVMWATVFVDMNLKIDDPSGTAVAHLLGGAWGTLAVGVFGTFENLSQRMRVVGVQAVGVVGIALITVIVAGGVFVAMRSIGAMRVSEADEYDGLDLAEHDLNAYPDFQQTMIKSYHLREA